MRSIHVLSNGTECLLRLLHTYVVGADDVWVHKLNVNYPDDLDEIRAAIAVYPSRIDKQGQWILCDFDTLKCTIRKIVAAHVSTQIPMLFLRASVRRGLIALGCVHICSRQLPRDLLREVHSHMPVEGVELEKLFRRYYLLRYITGLYVYAVGNGVRGPRIRVTEIFTYMITVGWHDDYWYSFQLEGGIIKCDYVTRCAECKSPHFCAYMNYAESLVVVPYGRVGTYCIWFEADGPVEFVHKRLDKLELPE